MAFKVKRAVSNFVTSLIKHLVYLIGMWLGVAPRTITLRHVFTIDGITCSKYNNLSKLKSSIIGETYMVTQ